MRRGSCIAACVSMVVMYSLALTCSSASANSWWGKSEVITGSVLSAGTPISGTQVRLYATRGHDEPKLLAKTSSRRDGTFTLTYPEPWDEKTVLYLTTRGGKLAPTRQRLPKPFSLATVLGPAPYAQSVTLNERTTVAAGFALAQFLRKSRISGKNPGLTIASLMVRHLVNIETGELGATITNEANGSSSLTPNTFNEMANLLATCATSAQTCQQMLDLAPPLHGKASKDTFQAIANMAANPWRDPVPLFNLVGTHPYLPDLGDTPPSAWVLALKFPGDPRAFAGPANMAVDKNGQIWVGNNYVHEEGFILPDCAGDLLYELDPTTGLVNTYSGGGIDGVGYGISIAPNNDIWVGNFGFKGETCPRNPASDSVSQFKPDGTPLSPAGVLVDGMYLRGGGWTDGGIGWPQGTVANRRGDIWIASCNGETINDEQVDLTIYKKGDHTDWFTISEPGLVKPFDVAFDTNGLAWVTGTNSDNLFAFNQDGVQIPGSPFDLGTGSKPMGLASDSFGNVWVTLSGILELPCPDVVSNIPGSHRPAALMFNEQGLQARSKSRTGDDTTIPGGLTIAWGIAIDGADNVWVANFGKDRLSSFCGANTNSCPDGYETGDALSPDDTGYASELLDRNTALTIDPSGNVWLANNWKNVPVQIDPAGDGLVAFIGLAVPVKAPHISGMPLSY